MINKIEDYIFSHRRIAVGIAAILTLFMLYSAFGLHIDASFSKLLPLKHEYMKTYVKHRDDFGGANRVLIALEPTKGDIFTPEFMDTLKKVTDDVFFLPGVDRSRVKSIFTPNVRFTEVTETGIAAGNVIPDTYPTNPAEVTKEDLEQVRRNILKSGQVGRLISNDFKAAMISAELLEVNPSTQKNIDYIAASKEIEAKIRDKYENGDVKVHIIGFVMVVGNMAEGAIRVVQFFGIAILITFLLVYLYTQSFRVTILPITCSIIAVVWQMGTLTLLGFGIDPMSILVPFLVFAIGVSHGVQMVSANAAELFQGRSSMEAARASFRRLLVPGGIALISDTIGFITILLIDIQVIREIAITASLGVAVIILTNLFLLPILLSFVSYKQKYIDKVHTRWDQMEPFWNRLSHVAERKTGLAIIVIALILMGVGLWQGTHVAIGDIHRGVPELRAESRYNQDSAYITDHFSIGVDLLSVIVETKEQGCIDYDIMNTIDQFEWQMTNVEGVQSVIGLPGIAKTINAGWNEGSMKWRVLSRIQDVLIQSVTYVPTDSGLLNNDCSVMPILIFTSDHKAETISRIVNAVKKFDSEFGYDDLRFKLATGNVGVMAATNEAIQEAQFPMLIYVFSAIILLCLLTFRSIRATLCIVLPLALVSLLAYALMNFLEIGLKVSTLPIVALGVGIGVDYGIYIYSRFKSIIDQGVSLQEAYHQTLSITGNGVLFTGITLAIGVATWIFSTLQFQADMGILLTFMFLVNMLGALLLLPALASWLLSKTKK
ncbi:MAG: RND transporter [Acidobacteria bacterium]|nr:MAG: RND transporter [Acidobacteriota bacterium]